MTADSALIDRLVARQAHSHATECTQAIEMLTFVADARKSGERLGGTAVGRLEASAAVHEISLALKVPVGTLQSALAGARLAQAKVPSVWAAWRVGTIGAAQVGAIIDTCHRLQHDESIATLDTEVIPIACERTYTQLRRWLTRFVNRVEPELAEDRHDSARRERRVSLEVGDDGMSWLSALIPSTEAAAIDDKLETIARTAGTDDPRTHNQQRADALSQILLGEVMLNGSANDGAATRIDIGVVVPVQSLIGLSDTPGELVDRSASVPASYIRNLAARPGTLFWRLLTDERGNLLDVAKIGRFAPADLGMAIRFRDGTSVFPTSMVPAANCDNDHTISYPAPTTATNLGALHRRAHRLKTEGLLSVRQPQPGVFDWTTSTGHIYTKTPEPLPTTAWQQAPWFAPEFLNSVAQEIDDGHAPAA